MDTPRYAGFTMRTECPSCGMPLPLDRPCQQVECSQCHATTTIPEQLWQQVLYLFEGDTPPEPGMMHTHNVTIAGFPLQIQVAAMPPACEQCGTLFPADALSVGTAQNFACVSCGDPASTLPAPAWLQRAVRTTRQLYTVDPQHEIPGGAEMAAVDVEAPQPVVMACPQCGGSLQITTEHARVTGCQYCGAEVFLPDEVWRRLHPVRTVRWWYVRFEGLTVEKAVAQNEQAEQAAAQAKAAAEKAKNVARAKQLMTPAWAFVALLFLVHVLAWVLAYGLIPGLDMSVHTRLMWAWLCLIPSVVLVTLSGYPARVASGQSGVFWFIAVGALFCLVPAAGGLLGVVGGLIVLLKKKDPAKIDSGLGKPLGAAFAIHGLTAGWFFIYTVSQG